MLLRTTLTGVICLCFCTLIFSQSFPIPAGIKKLKDTDAIITDDFMFVVGELGGPKTPGNNIGTVSLISINRKTQQTKSQLIVAPGGSFAGFRETEQNIDLYLRIPKIGSIDPKAIAVRFDKAAGEFGRRRDLSPTLKTDAPVIIVTDDGAVCFGYSSKEETLTVLKDDGENVVPAGTFVIEDKELRSQADDDASVSINTDFEQAYLPVKWYYRDGSLLLISDLTKQKENADIEITEFNTATSKVTSKTLNLDYDRRTDHNSFLFGNQLFVMSKGKDGQAFVSEFIALDIYDIKTLSKIKGKKYTFNEFFPYRTANNYYEKNKATKIENLSTSGVVSAIGRTATPVIHVNTGVDSLLEVSLGTYIIQTSGGGMVPGGAGGGGMVMMPSSSREMEGAFVLGLMNRSTLEPLENQIKISTAEDKRVVWLETNKKNVKPKDTMTIRRNGHLYITYVDSDKNTIELVELK